MDDLSFYDLQSGTTQSEVSSLLRFLLAPDTVPWPYGSKRVSVCCSPDLNHLRTPEVVYWDTQVSDCQGTVQRCKEELTVWFPSEAVPGIKDHPGCRGDGALSRACCLDLVLGTSTADLSLSSARHEWPQLTAASCQAFKRRERTLSRRNPVYRRHSPCCVCFHP